MNIQEVITITKTTKLSFDETKADRMAMWEIFLLIQSCLKFLYCQNIFVTLESLKLTVN